MDTVVSRGPRRSGTILVIDDEPVMRQVCARMLAADGFQVHCAEDGEQALAMLEALDPDIVLTDVRMPGSMDGLSLLREARRRNKDRDVIVMTGGQEIGNAVDALRGGAADYLVKPFEPDLLLSVVRRCLDRRRMSKELNKEKLLREELQAAYSELQKVEKLKAGILGRLHHELKTPITAAMLAVECLTGNPPADAREKSLSIARTRLEQLKSIMEDLLLYCDLRRGGSGLRARPTDLREAAEEAASSLAPLFQEKRITLSVRHEPDQGTAFADPALTAKAVKHLLLNAAQFAGQDAQVELRTGRTPEGHSISVADTGPGVPAGQEEAVFDSFYQIADHMTRSVGGIGLGLAIVRSIAEAHGGSATAGRSAAGGARFSITLPTLH